VDVRIEPIPLEQKPVLARLLQLYIYDFTEFEARTLEPNGEYAYRYLDAYWDPDPGEQRHAYFIRAGEGELAGFALVRYVNNVHVMAEFFVMRPYRRSNVGSTAARVVFEAHPGRWLVHEVPANLPAQAFWRRVIGEATAGRFEEEIESDGGVAQRFTISPP